MTITIKGLSKDGYIKLTHSLDIFAGEGETNVVTSKEVVTYAGGLETVLYGVTIHNTDEYTLKLDTEGVYICRSGIIPSYYLPNADFDKIFII